MPNPSIEEHQDLLNYPLDPLTLASVYWPRMRFYDKQVEVIRSVQRNIETVVVAGNQLGKDFVAGFIGLTFFLWPQCYFPSSRHEEVESSRQGRAIHLAHTRRIVTTSVRDKHLDVLWAEVGRLLVTAEKPLLVSDRSSAGREGKGILIANSKEIRLTQEWAARNPVNYLIGTVSQKGEGLAGHHAEYTLCIIDEASGVDDTVYDMAQTWARRFLIFGNPNQCTNFFYRAVKEGDRKVQQ